MILTMRKKKSLIILLGVALAAVSLTTALFISHGKTVLDVSTGQGGEEPFLSYSMYDVNGDGYTESAYVIENAANLVWFANTVNNNGENGPWLNAVLANDIDLDGVAWAPIGVNGSEFRGYFNGDGHTIKNMCFSTKQNGYNGSPTYNYQGLFGVVSNAVVRNVTVEGEIILTQSDMKFIGGVVGFAHEDSRISNVTSYVNINDAGTAYKNIAQVGGVVGQLGKYQSSAATVENSKYYGTINVDTASSVGGIAGQSVSNGKVLNCENYGKVGWNYIGHAGGVIGSAQSGTTVSGCANYGVVDVCRNDCVGGVVGYANENVSIIGCVNAGEAYAKKSDISNEPDVYLGGILGYINNTSFTTLENCFNYGIVQTRDGGNIYRGAIVGYVKSVGSSAVKNNYYYSNNCSDAYGSGGQKPTAPTAASVLGSTTTTWSSGWYVAKGTVTINSKVTVSGNVNLLLADGSNLTTKNIIVNKGNSFSVWGESAPILNDDGTVNTALNKSGKLNAICEAGAGSVAAIGSEGTDTFGNITINGGVVTANGGSNGAGIGSGYGYGSEGRNTKLGNVTINGGYVDASGRIGIGGIGGKDDNAGIITINGGTVMASGDGGIIAGYDYNDVNNISEIIINGGNVTAKTPNGYGYAAIGGSPYCYYLRITINGGNIYAESAGYGAGIGVGWMNNSIKDAVIDINGGTITAKGYQGVGCGKDSSGAGYSAYKMKININGGTVTALTNEKAESNEQFSPFVHEPSKVYKNKKVLTGDSVETLTALKHSQTEHNSIIYKSGKAVRVERCTSHGYVVYANESQHCMECEWCGESRYDDHVFGENGICRCGAWRGSYLNFNSETGEFTEETRVANSVTANDTTWSAGWYVAIGQVNIDNRVTVTGDVHLIIADEADLKVNGGIDVSDDDNDITNGSANSFTVYAQSQPDVVKNFDGDYVATFDNKTGKFTVTTANGDAGIGGGAGKSGGTITINGGIVNATCNANRDGGAGIGGGANSDENVALYGGEITINGGCIAATCGDGGAGIGSGYGKGKNPSNGGIINITGGDVKAEGGYNGAGIGGGGGGNGGTITISGGTVDASVDSSWGAGIGGGYAGKSGEITISGGIITATGGNEGGAGIGGGGAGWRNNVAVGEKITISGGTITATGRGGGAGIGGGSCSGYGNIDGGEITISGGTISATGGYCGFGIGAGHCTDDEEKSYVGNAVIKIEDAELITAVGQGGMESFSSKPTVATTLRTAVGDTLDVLTDVEYKAHADGNVFEGKAAAQIKKCTDHANTYSYIDSTYHSTLCKWCDVTSNAEHSFDDENGICVCGVWHGEYLDYDASNKTFVTKSVIAEAVTTDNTEWTAGWYVAAGNLTIDNRVTVTGDVHLIIADGATFTVNGGIKVQDGNQYSLSDNSLTVYAQSQPVFNSDGTIDEENCKTGKLTALSDYEDNAGIGGERYCIGGEITISGGIVNATGSKYGAGIGGGNFSKGGIVTINGGTVNATGGEYAAGIGGGNRNEYKNEGDDFVVTINGGTVNATGGEYGAGIGGGFRSEYGKITINGGDVTATAKCDQYSGSAGIGAGSAGSNITVTINGGNITAKSEGDGNYVGAGIGGGYIGEGINITITGGNITAKSEGSGEYAGAGIGSGRQGKCEKIAISGGSITAYGGANGAGIGSGCQGTVNELTISGGVVTAYGRNGAVGIGSGYRGYCNAVTITGGTVTAVKGETASGAFSAKPTLGGEVVWNVLAGIDLKNMQFVDPTVDGTYTENAAVRIFDGNEIFKIQLDWSSMEYIYRVGDWNPNTHSYGEGSWSSDGGKVTVKNNGNTNVIAQFEFTAKADGITGSLSTTSFVLGTAESGSTDLSISGKKPSTPNTKENLGELTVRIRKEATVASPDKLSAAINSSSHVKLSRDITVTSLDRMLTITRDTVIDLNGHTLTFDMGAGASPYFLMQILHNTECTIRNGKINFGSNGGVRYVVENYGTLRFDGVTCIGNFEISNIGILEITNSTFENEITFDEDYGGYTVSDTGRVTVGKQVTISQPFSDSGIFETADIMTILPGVYFFGGMNGAIDYTSCVDSSKYTVYVSTDGYYTVITTGKLAETGWVEDEGGRYYFVNADVVRNSTVLVDGDTYLLGPGGNMLTSLWYTDTETGNEYYFGDDGKMCIGWKLIDDIWCYFDNDGIYDSTQQKE